jgi:hypothetical protein
VVVEGDRDAGVAGVIATLSGLAVDEVERVDFAVLQVAFDDLALVVDLKLVVAVHFALQGWVLLPCNPSLAHPCPAVKYLV